MPDNPKHPSQPAIASTRDLLYRYPALDAMVREGRIRLGAPNRPGLYPRLEKLLDHAEVMHLLDEERGDR